MPSEPFLLSSPIRMRWLTMVLFYFSWCGPCKVISPILKKLTSDSNTSAEGNGRPIDLVTIDTDAEENMSLSIAHKVRGL